MALKVSRKKHVNVFKLGIKIVSTIIGLWASGLLLNVVGDVMINTSSPFYTGLRLIGWTVGNPTWNATHFGACDSGLTPPLATSPTSVCLTSTTGTGVLSIIGLLAIVWILFEFIDIKM